jgi:GcrA cell cycle regulator
MNIQSPPTTPDSLSDSHAVCARHPSIWTPEQQARALRLYLDEGFTAADVADALGAGFSRAAVIGKIRRLGFLKRDRAAAAPPSCRAPRIRRTRLERRLPPQRPPQPLPRLREVAATGAPTRLADLACQSCRWPLDDPGAGQMHLTLFCAGPATRGVYCEAHHKLAHDRSAPPVQPEAEPQPAPLARAA